MQKADFGPMLEINEINSVVIKILLDNVVFFFFFFFDAWMSVNPWFIMYGR